MDIQEIEVEIDPQGQVTLHVKGIQGAACLSITEDLEQALGKIILNRQMTPEAAEDNLLQTLKDKPNPTKIKKQTR